MTVAAIHGFALSVEYLDAAETAVDRFAEKQLQLMRRLVELGAG